MDELPRVLCVYSQLTSPNQMTTHRCIQVIDSLADTPAIPCTVHVMRMTSLRLGAVLRLDALGSAVLDMIELHARRMRTHRSHNILLLLYNCTLSTYVATTLWCVSCIGVTRGRLSTRIAFALKCRRYSTQRYAGGKLLAR